MRAGNPKPFHYGGGLKDLCKYGNFADSKSAYNARIVAKCAENPSPEGTARRQLSAERLGLAQHDRQCLRTHRGLRLGELSRRPADGSPWRAGGGQCESFATRSYFFDSIGTALRSAARCTAVGMEDRSNGLAIRVAVSLDDAACDRKK